MQLHTVNKSHIFNYKSRKSPYQVLRATHAVSECAMKSKVSHDKIITTVPSYTKKYHSFVAVDIVTHMAQPRNNTDGNKLVIFSSIALYYDDTYIFFQFLCCLAQAYDWSVCYMLLP